MPRPLLIQGRGFSFLKISRRKTMMPKKQNIKTTDKGREYYLSDCDCLFCNNYSGKKRGCKLEKCCCEQEKLEAKAKDRIRRKRGAK
jgi:hypothetical protein